MFPQGVREDSLSVYLFSYDQDGCLGPDTRQISRATPARFITFHLPFQHTENQQINTDSAIK